MKKTLKSKIKCFFNKHKLKAMKKTQLYILYKCVYCRKEIIEYFKK